MTQWPKFQQDEFDGNTQRGGQQRTSLRQRFVDTNASLSSLEIASRIQQTASLAIARQNQQIYTGHELVEVLATMYPASSEEQRKPVRLGTIQCVYQVPAPIGSLAWTPDGKHIALSYEHTVMLCNIETREEVAIFTPHVLFKGAGANVTRVAFSPDGSWIAIARSDREVEVQSTTTGAYEVMYSGHAQPVDAVAWSHTGNAIASSDSSGLVQVWNFATGKLINEYRSQNSTNKAGEVPQLLWSTDDKLLLACRSNRIDALYDLTNPSGYRAPNSILAVVQSAATFDTWDVAVAGVDNTPPYNVIQVQIGHLQYATRENTWQVTKGLTYARHQGRVRAVAFSPDGKRVASSGEDQTIQIWNTQDSKGVFTFRVHTLPVTHLSWSPDGTRLASADEQGYCACMAGGITHMTYSVLGIETTQVKETDPRTGREKVFYVPIGCNQ